MADDITARARAALEGVTQPWHWSGGEGDDPALVFIDAAPGLMSGLLAEVERLHTWDGLMSLLDEHWPNDIFPTLRDDPSRDPGPRIVSLLRWVEQLNVEVENQRTRALDVEFELTMSRGGVQVRPMTETESNLMTQVLDLRRERAEALAEVERLRGALESVAAEWESTASYHRDDVATAFKDCALDVRDVLRGGQ